MTRTILALVAALGICTTPLHASADPPDDRVELSADQVVVDVAAAAPAEPAPSTPDASIAGADAGTTAPADAVTVPVDVDDPAGMLGFAYDAIANGRWGWAAIALSILLTYAIRRWPHLLGKIGLGAAADWIGTAKGGVVLAGITSFGGWALHSAVAAGGWPTSDGLDVALDALLGSLAVLLPGRPKDAKG